MTTPSFADAGAAASVGVRTTPTSPVAAPAVSLPKGGGAIRGIGEKFGANPVTGTGSISVPIGLSPGRSGFAPSLSLQYDSGAGNGIFGIGWSLSLPEITRRTDRGIPQYRENRGDTFVLSGAEDLVEYQGRTAEGWRREPATRQKDGLSYTVRRYRPRVEGLFARIERWTESSTGLSHWRSITRDNVTSIYGRDQASRIADPTDPRRTFSWLICESYDDRGNAISYDYKAEDDAGVDMGAPHEAHRSPASRTTNRYIKRIRYGNRVSRLVDVGLATPDWMFEIVFDYGDHDKARPTPAESTIWATREDPFSTYRSGFEVRTYRRCQRIMMFHHFPTEADVGPDCLVRSTELVYRANPVASVVMSVVQAGFRRLPGGGYLRAEIPPVEFDYSAAEIDDQIRELDTDSMQHLPVGVDDDAYRWIDLDGEGLSGVLSEHPGAWYFKPNLGCGRLGPREVVVAVPATTQRHGFIDLAGDGQLDLVDFTGAIPGFYERTRERRWESFRAFRARPTVDFEAADLHQVDLTGDGHVDLLVADGNVAEWFPSLAEDGFAAPVRVTGGFDEGVSVPFSEAFPSIATYLADMSGDGLSDYVRISNGDISYWPNLGYGRFGEQVTMDDSPMFDEPDQFDPGRLRLADIDGSGPTDVIYLHRDGARIYANRSGNGWGPRQVLSARFPDANSTAHVNAVDLLGNGTACLVWSSPLAGDRAQPLRYIDLMGGQKPHLLVRMRNNLGADTIIDYAPSTRFYLDDKAAGHPWATRLPFPVHVVERVETRDLISGNVLTTRYAYHHGCYDGVEREFRGFGIVEQWDTEILDALTRAGASNLDDASSVPPVLTRTWFHTGSPGDAEVSRHLSDEYYREDAAGAGLDPMPLLDDTVLPSSVRSAGLTTPWRLSAEDEREARRALKGSLLRQEVYACDGSSAEGRPYVVAENNYTIEMLQPALGDHAVFFVHARETLTAHYERTLYPVAGAEVHDPRVTHELTLETDEYGNVTRSVSVAYRRRHEDPDPRLSAGDRTRQATTHLLLTEATYTNPVLDADDYRVPLPSEVRTWEVKGLTADAQVPGATKLFGLDELIGKLAAVQAELPYSEWSVEPGDLAAPARRLIEQTRTRYRQDDLAGPLPVGALESRALPFEEYRLALPDDVVIDIYGADVDQATLTTAGYVHDDGGWSVPSGQLVYSRTAAQAAEELDEATNHFFLPRRFIDPFGAATDVDYDGHDLLITATRDALNNETTLVNDYRVLQPALLIDANRNRSGVAFDALGLVVATAVGGKQTQNLGDTLDGVVADIDDAVRTAYFADPFATAQSVLGTATTRLVYDLFAFARTSGHAQPLPAAVATLARDTHVSDLAPGQQTGIQLSFSYSDGFGREIQRKVQAEPGPVDDANVDVDRRWTGTGWMIFNNKGKPVRKYEPFFSGTHDCEFDRTVGVSPVIFYDPLERVVATILPNGTWEKHVIGTWGQADWDANDTVQDDPGQDPDVGGFVRPYLAARGPWVGWRDQRIGGAMGPAEESSARQADTHSRTPSQIWLDTLARPFLSIAHNRTAGADEFLATRIDLDIEGNQREIVDALGRVVMRFDVDLRSTQVRQSSMEAGERRELRDVTGQVVMAWGTRGFRHRIEYDELRRPVRAFVEGGAIAGEILEQTTEYGDSQPPDDRNLRTRVLRQRDAAGSVTNTGFDFKGNPLGSTRELATEYAEALDWSAAVAMNAGTFTTASRFDALNRPTLVHAPDGTEIRSSFNEAGLLEALDATLPGGQVVAFITDIDYNANGQRTLCVHGNGSRTEYTYDPLTFRLTRLRTSRGLTLLQDVSYTFDPVGNITRITDDAQQPAFFRNRLVEATSDFTYDAVYRLVEATGREHLAQTAGGTAPIPITETDAPRMRLDPGDSNPMGRYVQRYVYDAVGNFLEMAHQGTDPAHPGWRRRYTYQEPSQLDPNQVSNRLTSTSATEGGTTPPWLTYDEHGNTTSMPELPTMRWNHRDELSSTARQVVSVGVPETTYYVYDASGQRVRKVTERQAAAGARGTRLSERIYIGGFEVHRTFAGDGNTIQLERQTTHIMDDRRRVAMIERRTAGDDGSPQTLVRYQFGDHLGSSNLELDEQAQVISYEEYFPYGSTSYQAVRSQTEAPNRYRYTSMERDEESGLSCHSARYYAPWLGRWTAPDPAGLVDGPCLYCYCRDSPIDVVDVSGTEGRPPPGMIGNDPRIGAMWEQVVVETLGPRFQTQTYAQTIDAFKREVAARTAAYGGNLGSNRLAGSAINYARRLYSSARTAFGGGAAQRGISLGGLQIHHMFSQLAQMPAEALTTMNLMFARGNASTAGSGHYFAHLVAEKFAAGASNPGQAAVLDLDARGLTPDVEELSRTIREPSTRAAASGAERATLPTLMRGTERAAAGVLRLVGTAIRALGTPELGAVMAENEGEALYGVASSYVIGRYVLPRAVPVAASPAFLPMVGGGLLVEIAVKGKQGGFSGAGHMYSKGLGSLLRSPAQSLEDARRDLRLRAIMMEMRNRERMNR
jgi:RHS repeat-associated protein